MGNLVDLPLEIVAAAALPVGFHTLGIRSKNTDGAWGFAERRQFYIPENASLVDPLPADIQDLEYFFDVDPGFGSAIPLTITTGDVIDINRLIPESLAVGYHFIHIRAKNVDGRWGLSESRPVYIPPTVVESSTADIVKMEYYFDGADPGAGNAIDLPIVAGPLVDLNTVDVPTSTGLIDGQHEITFRAQNANGAWSMAEVSTFDVLDDCTQPIAGFTPQLACAGQTVTFVDNSTSIQPDATYRWYLNGDAIVDNTTVGNSTFTYPFPGTYVVALAIRQGTICLDSIATTIDIQPLPIAVFSTSGTAVNLPTSFAAAATNVPLGATWEWDFDGDLAVDDNTVGSTSFTYTTEATYNPTLTITDGLGCEVMVTNPVVITSEGGGSSPPEIDFLPANGCVGNAINFIDLSKNLPIGATYSWDFDGDGTEDNTNTGSQSFTYTTTGSYNAKLIIDLGGGTIEATHTIEIVDVPIADFSATDVCEGSVMDFTDLSTKTALTAVYMWDFDNDGIVDSNAKTSVASTFASAGSQIVSLSITNGYGCSHEIVKQVNVVSLPTPDFEWGDVCTDETVAFNNLSTGDTPTSVYSWDLDGDTNEDYATTGDVDFIYVANGMYDATLTITNISGCSATITKPIEIFDRPEVVIDVFAQCYGQASQMVDLSQKVGASATYAWDFENDSNVDDNTVGSTSFTYTAYNSYIVNLAIDNGGGCASSAEKLVVFKDAATPDFMVNKTCQGEEVVFTDLSTNLENAAIYSWDFNGDGLENSAHPGSTAYTFNEAGTYNATLTIDNGGQCLAFKTVVLDVTAPPAIDLGADMQLCIEGTVTFDAGIGYASYLWPDGSGNQTYTVDQVGSYDVVVQDAKGCYNTDNITVSLMGSPIPSFTHAIELSLAGIKVSFANTSTNADTYLWSFGDGATATQQDTSHIYSDFSFYETSVYEVCLTATNDCATAQICEDIFVSPTQFLQEGGNEVNVYPNPANQYVIVELDQSIENYKKIVLFDVHGKAIWTNNSLQSRFEISMEEFTRGTYYLILEHNDGFLYKRIIKN